MIERKEARDVKNYTNKKKPNLLEKKRRKEKEEEKNSRRRKNGERKENKNQSTCLEIFNAFYFVKSRGLWLAQLCASDMRGRGWKTGRGGFSLTRSCGSDVRTVPNSISLV